MTDTPTASTLDAAQVRLRENLASFDAEVDWQMSSEAERADLWEEIDVNVDDLRTVLDALEALQQQLDEARAERDEWKASSKLFEATAAEAARGLECLSEIDDAWDAFGSAGNRKVLTLAEQIASRERELEAAELALSKRDAFTEDDPGEVCPTCSGRGTVETGEMENGCGGWGFVSAPCGKCDGDGFITPDDHDRHQYKFGTHVTISGVKRVVFFDYEGDDIFVWWLPGDKCSDGENLSESERQAVYEQLVAWYRSTL